MFKAWTSLALVQITAASRTEIRPREREISLTWGPKAKPGLETEGQQTLYQGVQNSAQVRVGVGREGMCSNPDDFRCLYLTMLGTRAVQVAVRIKQNSRLSSAVTKWGQDLRWTRGERECQVTLRRSCFVSGWPSGKVLDGEGYFHQGGFTVCPMALLSVSGI